MNMTLDMYLEKLQKIKETHGGDIPIVTNSDNYEMHHSIVAVNKYHNPNVSFMKKKTRHFRDDFDGTSYSADVYVHCQESDEDSQLVLRI